MSDIIKGTYPAIVTPMKRDGNPVQHGINYDVLPEFLEFLAKGGVDGFVVCGCTGADALLSHDEQVEFIKKSNEHIKELETSLGKPLLVIAGDGSNYTYETSELAKRVEGETGVTTHLQISPYKVKPTQTGILRHYEAIADGIEGRIIVYSVNGRTGGPGILPATALELAAHDQFIAIKEATAGDGGNVRRAKEIMDGVREGDLYFTVLSGDDDATLQMMRYGATGVISVAANAAPGLVSGMVRAKLDGNGEQATEFHRQLAPLVEAIFIENNPQDVMYALSYMGIDVGVPRLPLTEPSDEAKQHVERVVDEMGLKRS